MLKLVLLVPRWVYLSVERYLAAQEAQVAALSRLVAEIDAEPSEAEEPDVSEEHTWYDADGNKLMGPKEHFGLSEDHDEAELVFIQRIPCAKKPS
jgi:hypothetical protein